MFFSKRKRNGQQRMHGSYNEHSCTPAKHIVHCVGFLSDLPHAGYFQLVDEII